MLSTARPTGLIWEMWANITPPLTLNPLVGVVSLSTDLSVPTMWTHYALNTGIVVGYDTEVLRNLGFELRQVSYTEIAPMFEPTRGDVIQLQFADRERMEQETRAGRIGNGTPILGTVGLTQLGADWQALSQLLFVKGPSWEYEKEVRLLVDLQETRDTGEKDDNRWPIKVIDVPPEAIKEIYGGVRTSDADLTRAAELARGEDKCGHSLATCRPTPSESRRPVEYATEPDW